MHRSFSYRRHRGAFGRLAIAGAFAFCCQNCEEDRILRRVPLRKPVAAKPHKPTRVTKRKPNKKGGVIVLEYHKFAPKETRYDRSISNFKHDLARLYAMGFRPVTMSQYVQNKMDLAPGASPVVFTLDDSAPSQFQIKSDGSVDPDSAVGVWQAFAQNHPDFPVKATWYVLPGIMWGQRELRDQKVALLKGTGSELGCHTWTHPMLNKLSDKTVEEQIAKSVDFIGRYGFSALSMAYPYGLRPKNSKLLEGFEFNGKHYEITAGVLTDTDIAPPPDAKWFQRYKIPRIEALQGPGGVDYWLDRVEKGKTEVYVEP